MTALAGYFRRHLHLPPGAADVLAVWSVHTHCFTAARHTPRLAITSPEKGCGKTTVLDLLEHVCCRALPTANITAPAVFRTVEAAKPTLLVDEADTFLAENEDLRGVLNAGHKRGGQVIRCVGENAEPRAFTVFAPAAIAAIGSLPGTIADRSITFTMQRAPAGSRPEPIRSGTEAEGHILARKAARWCADRAHHLAEAEPQLPPELMNRAADNWRILLAIGDAAGGDWPARLTQAEAALRGHDDGREGLGVMLLRDVRQIFAEQGAERLPTQRIVEKLVEMEDRPWPEMPGTRKPITAAWLTRHLGSFGIRRKRWRTPGTDTLPWGFMLADFADAFERYLPPDARPEGEKNGNPGTTEGNPETLSNSELGTADFAGTAFPVPQARNPAEIRHCSHVPTFSGGSLGQDTGEGAESDEVEV